MWLQKYEEDPTAAFIRVIPSQEKRPREDKFDSFPVPSWIGKLLSYYLIRIRPFLVSLGERLTGNLTTSLLLHTEKGTPLDRESLRNALKFFAQQALGSTSRWEPHFPESEGQFRDDEISDVATRGEALSVL